MSSSTKEKVAIFWHRRDLRLHDNAGLYYALKSGFPVIPLFIFDKIILDDIENKKDARLTFIYDAVLGMQKELKQTNADILVHYGKPAEVWQKLVDEFDIAEVYTNSDYEPYAIQRDQDVANLLNEKAIPFNSFKDQVIFEKQEILTGQKTTYTVFTPYSRAWKEKCNDFYLSSYPTEKYYTNLLKWQAPAFPTFADIGFERTDYPFPSDQVSEELLARYENQRNFPAVPGTSRLGIHFRFGTASIRDWARKAFETSGTWLNELIWRDFYQQIMWNFPHVGQGQAFKSSFDNIRWRNDENEFRLWREGKTGYPLVDAGMRQLNEMGFMHNRVRMVTASFLSKHLLIDWRWGEHYFAEKLLDYDFAANNGGWQWAVGSGTDAAPYFRIFSPAAQAAKFDPNNEYIKKWVPEFGTDQYPKPIVDHKLARERCLTAFKLALGSNA